MAGHRCDRAKSGLRRNGCGRIAEREMRSPLTLALSPDAGGGGEGTGQGAAEKTLLTHGQGLMTSRVCIVATVREPVPIVESFIRYHLMVGVTHFFLFFDDPNDVAIDVARWYPQVTAIASDDALRAKQRENRVYGSIAPF